MNYELRIKEKFKHKLHAIRYTLKASKGFTLIELLVVMMVLLVVGSILISILFSSLRGTNKVNSIENVRRNGNYALEQMGKMIRYSQSFDGVSADGVNFTDNCLPAIVPALTPTPTPSSYNYIRITAFDGGQTILSCIRDGLANAGVASYSGTLDPNKRVDLLDTTSVRINNCTITCQQNSIVSPPTVTIQFELSNRTTSLLSENQANNIQFQTSVTARNY
ncbi:MAG: prepilin-type N-terminal cleavage/methylation domain-containing protein [Patescibacteria group bacterium]